MTVDGPETTSLQVVAEARPRASNDTTGGVDGMSTGPVHVATARYVVTYSPRGWPVGVLTGYAKRPAFVLEHVIAFPGSTPADLRQMLATGLREAQAQGFETVVFHVPHAHPLCSQLERLGRRLGFVQYEDIAERRWWVKWL